MVTWGLHRIASLAEAMHAACFERESLAMVRDPRAWGFAHDVRRPLRQFDMPCAVRTR
jgi:hypothetical protein